MKQKQLDGKKFNPAQAQKLAVETAKSIRDVLKLRTKEEGMKNNKKKISDDNKKQRKKTSKRQLSPSRTPTRLPAKKFKMSRILPKKKKPIEMRQDDEEEEEEEDEMELESDFEN